MLGRAADNLYWMARNMERLENVARLIKTCRTSNMLSETSGVVDNIWDMPLDLSGQKEVFLKKYKEVNEANVIKFMLEDKDNFSSVDTLLDGARENARASRHLLTSDVWDCINRTWLINKDDSHKKLRKTSIDNYLEFLVDRSYMFKGVMSGSMRRGEGLYFSQLGQCIERVDHSARILNIHFNNLHQHRSSTGHLQVRDYYRAMLLLNALNAYKAYRETFHSSIEFDKIAELIIHYKEVPRSFRACIGDIANIIQSLNPNASVMKDVQDLQYRLDTVQISQLRRVGLGYFLSDFSKDMDNISLKIQNDFMMVE